MFKSDRVLTLSIGASKIVLADFLLSKSAMGPELLNYGVGYLDADPESDMEDSAYIVSTIRELMRDNDIKPAPLLMTVSGQSVFPRFVKLPPVSKDKIDQIVQYEAEQNVPFPINEVVWDYQLIDNDDGELSVMLVAVKIENVQRLTDCVVAAGLEPEIVDVAPMAVYNAVRYNYPDLDGCTMILDVGARSSNLIFIEGVRIFSRSIPVAGNAITMELAKEFELSFEEAEELKLTHGFVAFGGVYAGPDSQVSDRASKIVRNVITRLHAEVNRSINFYRSQQGGSTPSLVLLTGGSSIIPHSDTFFREKLKVDVEYLNPFTNVIVSDQIDTDKIAEDLQLMSEVVGLALRRSLTCPIEINLMPPDLVSKKVFRKRQPFLVMAAVGVVLIIFCWWVYCQRMHSMRKTQISDLNERSGKLSALTLKLKDVGIRKRSALGKMSVVSGIIRERTHWVEMIDAIHSCMLEGMWLTSVNPVVEDYFLGKVEISISGFQDKLRDVGDGQEGLTPSAIFRDKLRKTGYFVEEETKIKRIFIRDANAYSLEFIITAKLKDPICVNNLKE